MIQLTHLISAPLCQKTLPERPGETSLLAKCQPRLWRLSLCGVPPYRILQPETGNGAAGCSRRQRWTGPFQLRQKRVPLEDSDCAPCSPHCPLPSLPQLQGLSLFAPPVSVCSACKENRNSPSVTQRKTPSDTTFSVWLSIKVNSEEENKVFRSFQENL